MRRLLIIAAFFITVFSTQAQQNYNVANIPKELMAYSSGVVRNSDESILVKSLDNCIYHCKKAITVLNKNGDRLAQINLWYNKSSSIKSVKGSVYNASGIMIGKFSERDFEDINTTDGYSLFEDMKLKYYKPVVTEYPYTIEYEYETRSNQTLSLGSWDPNPGMGVSVEQSRFSFTSKPDFKINYKEINTSEKAVITTDAHGLKTYTWHISNLKSIKDEPFSPNTEAYLTMVKLSPVSFIYEGISGTYTNWNELGKWYYDKLLKGRDGLQQTTIDYIKELTAGINDPKLKAKKIYEYMQQKTRYVSIQVGIGSLQPFFAADVDKNSYGDCKALVYYTQALLKVAGIESWFCLVEAGLRKVSFMPDFASIDQGNHIILCIPFKNDTTWAECTSQKIPFGFLGDFTDDRWVLACTPEGGKLLHTPRYNAETNAINRKGNFVINSTGELSGDMSTAFFGTEYDTRESIIDDSYTEQLKYIKRAYPINNFDIEKLEFKKGPGALTTENIKLNARDFAALNSDKFYFKVNLTTRADNVPDEVRNRTTDVYINRGHVEDDQITYQLPEGFHPDRELSHKAITKPFGKFTVSMHLDGQKLTYHRHLQINEGTYNKDTYQELIDFYQNIADSDAYRMVLAKNN